MGLGEPDVAKQRLCEVEAIAMAYTAAGKPCASTKPVKAAVKAARKAKLKK